MNNNRIVILILSVDEWKESRFHRRRRILYGRDDGENQARNLLFSQIGGESQRKHLSSTFIERAFNCKHKTIPRSRETKPIQTII